MIFEDAVLLDFRFPESAVGQICSEAIANEVQCIKYALKTYPQNHIAPGSFIERLLVLMLTLCK